MQGSPKRKERYLVKLCYFLSTAGWVLYLLRRSLIKAKEELSWFSFCDCIVFVGNFHLSHIIMIECHHFIYLFSFINLRLGLAIHAHDYKFWSCSVLNFWRTRNALSLSWNISKFPYYEINSSYHFFPPSITGQSLASLPVAQVVYDLMPHMTMGHKNLHFVKLIFRFE